MPTSEETLRALQAERRRIAQLLHDTVAQSLTGTYLQAAGLERKWRQGGVEGGDDLTRLVEMLRRVVLEMRDVTVQLTPEEEAPNRPDENR